MDLLLAQLHNLALLSVLNENSATVFGLTPILNGSLQAKLHSGFITSPEFVAKRVKGVESNYIGLDIWGNLV